MGKKVIIKEVHQPVREIELDVEDGFMEDVMAPKMAFAGDAKFISLNRLNTMFLVVNPEVKPARGTAYFVRVTWVKDGFKKRAKLVNVTSDDLVYARNFMTDVYQRKLKENNYPMLFS